MTDEIMALHGLMEESADTDLLREMIGFAAERLMELEVGGLTGAAHNEKSAERLENDRIVSAAVIVTVGVNSDGRREVLGMDVGSSEAATFWTAFSGSWRAGAGAVQTVGWFRFRPPLAATHPSGVKIRFRFR